MQFILKGFTPELGFRVFAFERIGDDRTRTEFKVRTDLSLIRTYGIRLQELPLLCRGLLERRDEGEQTRTLTFTQEDMRSHANSRAADRDAAKRKSKRTPSPQEVGVAAGSFSGGNEIPVAKIVTVQDRFDRGD